MWVKIEVWHTIQHASVEIVLSFLGCAVLGDEWIPCISVATLNPNNRPTVTSFLETIHGRKGRVTCETDGGSRPMGLFLGPRPLASLSPFPVDFKHPELVSEEWGELALPCHCSSLSRVSWLPFHRSRWHGHVLGISCHPLRPQDAVPRWTWQWLKSSPWCCFVARNVPA